jgi:hypothetical protein
MSDSSTNIPGWDHFWHVPDDVTEATITEKLEHTCARFFTFRTKKEKKYTVLGHPPEYENELPPCLQLLYFTVFHAVRDVLASPSHPPHICYTGKHDIVMLMIAAAVRYFSDVDHIRRYVYVFRKDSLDYGRHRILGPDTVRDDTVTIKYINQSPTVEQMRELESFKAFKFEHLNARREATDPEYMTWGHPFLTIRLRKTPGQNPFAFIESTLAFRESGNDRTHVFDLSNSVGFGGGMGHIAWLSCLILLLPRFRLIIKTHPVFNKLVQFALDTDILETLDIETLELPITIPRNTDLNSVTFRYVPYGRRHAASIADLEPFLVSLANRRSDLPTVTVYVKKSAGNEWYGGRATIYDTELELQVLSRLVDIAMHTTSIARIIPQFGRFISLLSDPRAADKLMDMYHYAHTVGLRHHRMVGQDVCYLQLDFDHTELGYPAIYEMLRSRVFTEKNTKMASEFVLKNYLWGVYQHMFSLAHGTDEWRTDDQEYPRVRTVAAYTANNEVKVIMEKELFTALYNMQLTTYNTADLPDYPPERLTQLQHDIVQYNSQEWKLLPLETFVFVCRLMNAIDENLPDRGEALIDFESVMTDVHIRAKMYTRDEAQYLASKEAFEKLDDTFKDLFATKFLYRLSLNDWGWAFLDTLQANPSNADRFLKIQFNQSSERYRPSNV